MATEWEVYLETGRYTSDDHIDTVFYDSDMSKEEVTKSLIDHDGYDPAIYLIKVNNDFINR